MILLYYARMLYMNTIATLCKHAQKNFTQHICNVRRVFYGRQRPEKQNGDARGKTYNSGNAHRARRSHRTTRQTRGDARGKTYYSGNAHCARRSHRATRQTRGNDNTYGPP